MIGPVLYGIAYGCFALGILALIVLLVDIILDAVKAITNYLKRGAL